MKRFLKSSVVRELIGHQVLIILLLGVFIAIFMLMFRNSFAWFSSNKDVSGTGMQVAVKGPDYEILTLTGGSDGIYYDRYHTAITDSDTSTIIWQMTAQNEIGNYDSSVENNGIYPGTQGVISFFVHTFAESVDLDFTFEVLGYTATETGSSVTMTRLDSDKSPAVFLNGHILLFEERSGTAGNYKYSSPILTGADMKRVVSNKTYPHVDNSTNPATVTNPTRVDIYWVWPQTLSNIVDARGCQKEGINVTKIPLTYTVDETHNGNPYAGSAYNAIVDNIRNYPDFYLKGVSRPTDEDHNGTIDDEEMIAESNIVTDYDKYGDYYDLADNDIGMGKLYVLLKLNVSRHIAGE